MRSGGGYARRSHLDLPLGGIKLFGIEDVDEEGDDKGSGRRLADILESRRLEELI